MAFSTSPRPSESSTDAITMYLLSLDQPSAYCTTPSLLIAKRRRWDPSWRDSARSSPGEAAPGSTGSQESMRSAPGASLVLVERAERRRTFSRSILHDMTFALRTTASTFESTSSRSEFLGSFLDIWLHTSTSSRMKMLNRCSRSYCTRVSIVDKRHGRDVPPIRSDSER